MGEVVDGEYQKYVVEDGAYIREHFFGKYPELLEHGRHLSDEQLKKLRRGGHDPDKVYAAYKAAVETKGQPTVDPRPDDQGLRTWAKPAKARTSPTSRRSSTKTSCATSAPASTSTSRTNSVATLAVLQAARRQPGNQYLHERRQALGGYLPSRAVDRAAASVRRSNRSSRSSTRARTIARSRRRWCSSRCWRRCSATRKSASSSCRSSPTRRARSAWSRSSARSASTRTPVSSTSRSTSTRSLYYHEAQERADPRRRHHRGRIDVVVHRGGHGLRDATAST